MNFDWWNTELGIGQAALLLTAGGVLFAIFQRLRDQIIGPTSNKAIIDLIDPERYLTDIRTWVIQPTSENPQSIGFEFWIINRGQGTARELEVDFRLGEARSDIIRGISILEQGDLRQITGSVVYPGYVSIPPIDLVSITVGFSDDRRGKRHVFRRCYRLGTDRHSNHTEWQAHDVKCSRV